MPQNTGRGRAEQSELLDFVNFCCRSAFSGTEMYNIVQKMLLFQIEKLPDEVILLVLSFLSIKDLIKCSQLSRRFRSITYDKSLWQKSNLYQKIVPAKYVEMVINKGCLYLNLSCINMGTIVYHFS